MIDTHSHLFAEEFDDDRAAVMERAQAAGIERILMPNIDDTTVEALLRTCKAYPGYCFPMLGFHPTSVDGDVRARVDSLKHWLDDEPSWIAIGEIGMDLYWDQTYGKEQQQVLDQQIQWALEYHLPVVLHCREAFPETFEVLRPYRHTELSGVFHSFTGTQAEAEQVLEFDNFWIGINGVVTFKKSTLPDILKMIPLDRLVLETDSPYLAPVPFRGKRNESAYVKSVAEKLAAVYGMEIGDIDRQTTKNALKLFKKLE